MGMILANEKLGRQRNGLDKKIPWGGEGASTDSLKNWMGGQSKGPGNQYFRV